MPVPKKRQSKSQKNSRKFTWKKKASKQSSKAISKAKLVIRKLLTKRKINDNDNKTNMF